MTTLAYVLTVGSELTTGIQENSNSRYIASRLAELGIACFHLHSTSDDRAAIVHGLRDAFAVAEVVIVTGGLGPTDDDITREAVAEAVGQSLVQDEEFSRALRMRLGANAQHLRQAYRPEGASFLKASIGTAPGLRLEYEGRVLFAVPGVPEEMRQMFEEAIVPELRKRNPKSELMARTYKLAGIGEVDAEERLRGSLPSDARLGILPQMGEIHLRVTANPAQIAELDLVVPEIFEREYFGIDEESLPQVVGRLLREKGLTMSTVESCTGGQVAQLITEIPGSSEYFLGSIVAYSNNVKSRLVGVAQRTLREKGAVSPEAAVEMAVKGRKLLGSDLCVAITGIAGPQGGTEAKPVGLVYIALAWNEQARVEEFRFSGSRRAIRMRAAKRALNLVRLRLKGLF